MLYYPGDLVEWTAPDATVGPSKEVAVSKGEKRKVVSASDKHLLLEGQGGVGIYGNTHPANVKLVKRGPAFKLRGKK